MCIVEYLSKILHLELVYKFYLYDKNLGEKEIERWIGPNRSDSLLEKYLVKVQEYIQSELSSIPDKSSFTFSAFSYFLSLNFFKVQNFDTMGGSGQQMKFRH